MKQLVEKYKNLPKPVKASLWFVICSVIQKGISFITTPIFTRILTQDEYGMISLFNSWQSILLIFATLELATGVFNKAMVKYEDDKDGYTSSTLFLSSCATLVLFVVYLLVPSLWNRLTGLNTAMMSMLFVDIFLINCMSFYTVRARFEFNYRSVVILTLGSNILAIVLSVLFVFFSSSHHAEAKVMGTLAAHAVVYIFVFVHLLRKGKKLIRFDYWKYAVNYNLPLIPHYLSQQILNQSDRIMIGRICGNADVGVYSLAYQIAIVMNIVTSAVNAVFTPWAFKKIRNRKCQSIGEITFQIEAIICIICFAFALFAPEFVWVLGGKSYYNAIWIIPPVAMSVVFNMLYSLISNFAFYFEKTKFVMVGTMVSALINIVLNAIFIPRFGFAAAGYTTLFCYALYACLHYVFMIKTCKINGINNPFNGKKVWGVATIAVVLSVLAAMLYRNTWLRYGFLLVILTIGIMKRKVLLRVFKTVKSGE